MTLTEIVEGAVGPFDAYCDGYGNPGASGLGYVSAVTMELGIVRAELDTGLDAIVAYDRASSNGIYIGQINLVQATSFSGLNGAVWGRDLARVDGLDDAPLLTVPTRSGRPLPVYSMDPLLHAARALLGTLDAQRFRLLPGSRVTAAMRGDSATGPCHLWCALALAMAEDRATVANLFMEDVGVLPAGSDPEVFGKQVLKDMAVSVGCIAENHRVEYREVFASFRHERLQKGDVGAAMVVAPYLVLARDAVPAEGPASLLSMTLTEWERAVGLLSDGGAGR